MLLVVGVIALLAFTFTWPEAASIAPVEESFGVAASQITLLKFKNIWVDDL